MGLGGSESELWLSWLKGSSGFGDGEFIGVLRLRCASLRMTGCLGEINCRGRSFPVWEITRVGDGTASFVEYRGI